MGQRARDRPKHLPEKLLAIRNQLGVSQSQLARLLNFDRGSARISEYESGIREPSLLVLLAYAKLARVSVNVLIDDDKELTLPKNVKAPKQAVRKARGIVCPDA